MKFTKRDWYKIAIDFGRYWNYGFSLKTSWNAAIGHDDIRIGNTKTLDEVRKEIGCE